MIFKKSLTGVGAKTVSKQALAIAAHAAVESLETRILFGVQPANDQHGPVSTSPGADCPASPSSQSNPNTGAGTQPATKTGNSVRYLDGMPVYSETDLQSNGFGSAWGQTRQWTGLPNSSLNGNGWGIGELPYLTFSDKSGHSLGYYLSVVQGGIESQTFITDSGTTTGNIKPFYNSQATLSYDGTAHTFTYKDSNGGVWIFNDLQRSGTALDFGPHPDIDYSQRFGKLISYTDKAGTQAQVSYFTSGTYAGQVQYVTRSNATDSSKSERFEYGYLTLPNYAGANNGNGAPLLASVTLERKDPSGTWKAIRDAEYLYYTGYLGATSTLDPNGRFGDLKLVTIKDYQRNPTSGDIVNQSYYRYYKLTGTAYSNDWRSEGPTNDRTGSGGGVYTDKTGGVINTAMSYTQNVANYNNGYNDLGVFSALKSVTTGASFARLVANNPSYETATDTLVKTFANYTWRYERWGDYSTNFASWSPSYQSGTRYRAIEETAQSGCSTCSGGIGASRYDYTINPDGTGRGINQLDYNVWRMQTTDFLPDSTNADNNADGVIDGYEWADNDRTVTFTNEVGQVMLQDVVSMGHSSKYVSALTSSGTTATATVTAHGYSVGDQIVISSADQAAYNGVFTVTAVTTNTFSYTMASSPGAGATGVGIRVQKAVSSVTDNYDGTATVSIANHGFVNGDRIALAGADAFYDSSGAGNKLYSGVFTVSNATANTFDITLVTDPGFDPTGAIVVNKVQKEYLTYYRYQDRKGGSGADSETGGQLLFKAYPSAVSGFNTGYTDLVGFSGGSTYAYISSGSGEVETWTYANATSSTISETVAGDVAGYMSGHYVQQGTSGPTHLISKQDYVQRSAGGATMYFVAHEYQDKNDDGTVDQTTTHTYSWYSGTTQIQSETVEAPVVLTAENGPGGSVGVKTDTVYDLYGRPTWTRDADGHIDYTQYDPATGGVVKSITDVDTDLTGDFSNLPTGWANSSGLHLKTVMVLDGLGRVTKATDPNGNIAYTVYNDGAHEVRRYTGVVAQSGQFIVTAPITIAREYWPASGGSALGQGVAYREAIALAASAVMFDQRTPTSITLSGTVATVTLADHGLSVGDTVIISGATQSQYNGTFAVTDVTPTTFTYTVSGSPASPATGSLVVNLGRPTGNDVVSTSTIQSLNRVLYNNAGQKVETDNYTSLVGISSYSQAVATLGAIGLNFLASKTDYDSRGRVKRMQMPDGSTTRMNYDVRGLVTDVWKGTNDTTTIGYWSPQSQGGANLVKVASFDYDNNGNRTFARRVLTQDTTSGADLTFYSAQYAYDFRDRLTDERGPDQIATKYTYDNLGQQVEADDYADANSNFTINTGELRGKSVSAYDGRGQVYRSTLYQVAPSTGGTPGAIGDSLTTNYWYDARGNMVKTRQANGVQNKTIYDGAGRAADTYLTTDATESAYADALSASNDHVIEQTRAIYDPAGRDVADVSFKRKNDSPATGLLTSENSWTQSVVNWYDAADRITQSTNYGSELRADYDENTVLLSPLPTRVVFNRSTASIIDTNGNGIPDVADGAPPATPTSDTAYAYLNTKYAYDPAGRLYQVRDNKDRLTQTNYDLAGRKLATIENYANGVVAATDRDTDRTTSYVYDAQGRLSQIVATNADGTAVSTQTTSMLYTSPIDQSWVTRTVYPDSTATTSAATKSVSSLTQSAGVATATSTAHGYVVGDVIQITGVTNDARYNAWVTVLTVTTNTFTFAVPADVAATASGTLTARKFTGSDAVIDLYDRLGRKSTSTDQRGVVHTYLYNNQGRLISDSIGTGTLPANVDGTVRTIAYGYDDLSRQYLVSSKNSSGTIINEVKLTYDGWGNVIKDEQAHTGAVVSGTTPATQYSYADGATGGVAKYVRLDTLTYPNGRVVQYSYNTAGSDDDALSRINLIHDNATNKDLADYDWVGAYDFAGQVLHPNVSGGLTLTFGYGGNQMQGWDRFGRVIRVQWRNIPVGGVTTELDRFDYKYDRTGNRLTADRSVTVTGVNNDDNYSESYEYDGLDRLVDFRRGVQDGTGVVPKLPTSTSLKFRQTWGTLDASGVVTTVGLDALGNWAKFVQDADGGGATAAVTQTRTANAVNEIGSVTGNSPAWATPAYDAGGNMTTVPKGGSESTPVYFVYDGWNRLAGISATAVPDGDFVDATEVQYKYDGLGRRIAKDFAGGTASDEDSYYNEAYQELETRKAGSSSPYQQSVWDLRYVDAPLVRYRNADANTGTGTGGMEETLYETYDANYDVTGLVKEDETFVERYVYTPYGDRTVLTGTFAARGTSSYDFQLGHQGLRLDAESGTYYDRGRQDPYSLGVFGGRDPNGTDYQDGTNLYEEYQGNPTGMVDPAGTAGQIGGDIAAMAGSVPMGGGYSMGGAESLGSPRQQAQQKALKQAMLAQQSKQNSVGSAWWSLLGYADPEIQKAFDGSNNDQVNGYGDGLGMNNLSQKIGGTGYTFDTQARANAGCVSKCVADANKQLLAMLAAAGGAGLSYPLDKGLAGEFLMQSGDKAFADLGRRFISNAASALRADTTDAARLVSSMARAKFGGNSATNALTRFAKQVGNNPGKSAIKNSLVALLAAEIAIGSSCYAKYH